MPIITDQDIINLFEQAALTDKRLPRAIKKQKTTASWQEVKQEKMYKHSWNDATFVIKPSSKDISRWWIASTILREVVEDLQVKRIIWSRAKKIPFSRIARFVGVDRRKVKTIWIEEIMYIRLWLQLHQNTKKISDMIDRIVLINKYN
jgi:hypothetical protein